MSKISQDFIGNVGNLYEQINGYDQDFLNEESEYYDEESAELVEDILSSISLSMIYEGYSANAVIGFLADSSEEEIIEKYLSFDENILIESTVSEEYIEEQLEILNEIVGALFRVGKALVKGAKYAKGAKGAAPLTRLASGLKSAGTATERIAKQGIRSSSIVRSNLSKGVKKVKDIASKAKAALPGVAKGALAAGLGVLAGYGGAKLGSGGQTKAGKPDLIDTDGGAVKDLTAYRAGGGAAKSRQTGMTTREIEDLGRKNLARKAPEAPKIPADAAPAPSNKSSKPAAPKPKQPEKPKPSTETPAKKTKIQQEIEDIKAMQQRSKQRQGALMGGPEGPGEIDKKEVEAAIEAQKERDKKRAQASTQKESYDAYDFVLSYLMESGHADTIDEAHYLMLEMDSEMVGNIIALY